MKSRRFMMRSSPRSAARRRSVIDRRRRVEQQRRHVLDLLLGQDALVAEARHVAARDEGLGVEYLAIGVALHFHAVAARLPILIQAWPDRAEGKLGLRELMAGIAVGADGAVRIVGELLSASFLRDLLAVL